MKRSRLLVGLRDGSAVDQVFGHRILPIGRQTLRASLVLAGAMLLMNCNDSPLPSITPTPSVVTLVGLGSRASASVRVEDQPGHAVSNAPVTWTSKNPLIASVSGSGNAAVVTAVAYGNTQLTVTAAGAQATIDVVVRPASVMTVAVTLSSSQLIVGQTTQATAVARGADGNVISGLLIKWRSNNSATAVVDSLSGLVTAVTPGIVTISALIESVSGVSPGLTILPVPDALISLDVTPPVVQFSGPGLTQRIATTIVAPNGTFVTFVNSSSNDAVARVGSGSNPVITAIGTGSAVITITATGTGLGFTTVKITRTVTVTVLAVASVQIVIPNTDLFIGQILQATVVAKDAIGTVLTGRIVNWISANPLVAAVDPVSGVITAKALGSVEISATVEGVSGRISVRIVSLPHALTSFEVAPTVVTATGPGATIALTTNAMALVNAIVMYDNGSSNEAVATITKTGPNPTITVTGVGSAIIHISAYAMGFGYTADTITRTISVNVPAVATVQVSLARTSINIGEGTQATAIPKDDNSTTLTARAHTNWVSSNPTVARVDALGVITAVAIGTATISTSVEGVIGNAVITVLEMPSVTLSAGAVAVVQGRAVNASVNIARTNFSGSVSLSLVNPPTGIAATFDPVSANGSGSILTLAVAPDVAPGNYVLTLRGTGVGISEASVSLVLTVTAASSIALAVSPVSIQAGASGVTTLTITRANYADAVSLGVVSPPAGITAAFAPSVVAGPSASITVNVAATVVPGTYVLIIRGSGTAIADATTNLTISVIAGGSVSVTLTPAQVQVAPGGSATSNAVLTRTGYAGLVTLTAAGAPAGLTVAFSPVSTMGNTAAVMLSASASVALGTYAVTITGTGTGVIPASTTVQVQVTFAGLSSSVTRVSGRQLLQRKRLVNGSLSAELPVELKCVGYSPASVSTPSGDPNVRRLEYAIWSHIDIPLIRDMGANCVRLFFDPGFDGTLGTAGVRMLDEMYAAGISVIMTVDDGMDNRPRVQQAVNFYKNHPAILMWMLGNEFNIAASYCAPGSAAYYGCTASSIASAAQLIENSAFLIKSIDGNHAVSASYGEIDINADGQRLTDTRTYISIASHIDLWGLNIYRGASFNALFAQWESITTKPMFLGEFGTDAYDIRSSAVNQPMQAQWDLDLWSEIFKNFSSRNASRVAVGGVVFEWNDEYWKTGGIGVQDALGCGPPNCSGHPDMFSNEEYYGICRIDRVCRSVYGVLKAAFDPAFVPAPVSIVFGAISHGSNTPGATNGSASFERNGASFYLHAGGGGGARGFNIAVIDPVTGTELQPARNFDTWGTRSSGTEMVAMISYLNSLPTNTLILIAVGDEAGLNLDNSCANLPYTWVADGLRAIRALGGAKIATYCFRDSYSLIAYKGTGVALDEQSAATVEAKAQARITIP